MKAIIIGVLLTAGLATAQNALWVDLSGEWRIRTGDNPIYARPDFDDSSFQAQKLPWTQSVRPTGEVQWLRRSVELPPGTDPKLLAITLGPVSEAYELYVNGILIAKTGNLFDEANAQLAHSRSFPVPADLVGRDLKMHIAVRTRRVSFGAAALSNTVGGAYLITYREHTPRESAEDDVNRQRVRFLPTAILSALLIAFSTLILSLWITERQRKDLLWLGILVGLQAMLQTVRYFYISVDSFPARGLFLQSLCQAGGIGALTELILHEAGLHTRWIRYSVWMLCLAVAYSLDYYGVVSSLVDSFCLCILARAWWQGGAGRRSLTRDLTFGALALLAFTQMGTIGAMRVSLIPQFLYWGPYVFGSLALGNLALAAILAALSLRRLTEDRAERQRLSGELEAARTVQQLLLPESTVALAACEFDAVYAPAQEVGGDFYWSRVEADQSLLLVVGDVSGKGLKAAMLVSLVIGILRTQKSKSPAAVLESMNEGLVGHTAGGFVTACCARFDAAGSVTTANAGHPSPYCDGREVEVEAGLPLGIMAGVAYAESVVRGEHFTFVSDGVVEAENSRRELFGFERTREISTKSAREIAEAAKSWGQNDDITVVAVRRSA